MTPRPIEPIAARRGPTCRCLVNLVGVTLVVALATGCPASKAVVRADRTPDWVRTGAVPVGCAIGTSGDTFNASHAIVYAQENARLQLAQQTLGGQIRSILADRAGVDADEAREIVLSEMEGDLENVRVYAVWRDEAGLGAEGRPRFTYALACLADGDPATQAFVAQVTGEAALPAWVVQVPRSAALFCALGLAGRTLDPKDQAPNAVEDAQVRLAEAIRARVAATWLDIDRRGAGELAGWQMADDAMLARVQQESHVSEQWLDPDGIGPVGRAGYLYVLLCL